MDRGAWQATVYKVAESDTTEQLSTRNCTGPRITICFLGQVIKKKKKHFLELDSRIRILETDGRWPSSLEPLTEVTLCRQLRLQLWEAYCQVRYLCSHLRGNDSADSAVSTDSSMDESSETSSAKDVPAGSLRTALNELKRLIQSIVDGMEPTVRGRTECSRLHRAWRLKPSPEGEVGPGTRNLIKSTRMPSDPLSERTSHRGAGTGSDQPPESRPAGSGCG